MPQAHRCRRIVLSTLTALTVLSLGIAPAMGAGEPPAGPTDLEVTQGFTSVHLSWTAAPGPVNSTTIFRSRDSGTGFEAYATLQGDGTKIELLMAPGAGIQSKCAGNWYFLAQSARADSGGSESSNEANFNYTGLCVRVGGEVDAFQLGSKVEVTWTAFAGTKPTVAYNVYRSAAPGASLTRVNSAPLAASVHYFLDRGVARDTIWFYQVAAIDANGNEFFSAPAATATESPTPVPSPDLKDASWGTVKSLYR